MVDGVDCAPSSARALCAGLRLDSIGFRGQGVDRQRMDLASHQRPESLVDQLVPGDRPQAGELRCDHLGCEMDVVVGLDTHGGAGQSGADQVGDTFGGHGAVFMARV